MVFDVVPNCKNNNPVLFSLYDSGHSISENRVVYDGCIDMGGLPDSFFKIKVTDDKGREFVEVPEGSHLGERQFAVNYRYGWLYINPNIYNGKAINLEFQSRGIELTPASRIYTFDANGKVDIVNTLQKYIDQVNVGVDFEKDDSASGIPDNIEPGDPYNVIFSKLYKWFIYFRNTDIELDNKIGDLNQLKNADLSYDDVVGAIIDVQNNLDNAEKVLERTLTAQGGEINDLRNNLSDLDDKKADKQNADDGFEGGNNAKSETGGAVGYSATSTKGFAGGEMARTTTGGAIGYDAYANKGGGAVGENASTSGDGGAVGKEAKASAGGAIGYMAETDSGGAVGQNAESEMGGAVGDSARAYSGGAVGYKAYAGDGFSGGFNAQVETNGLEFIDAIQLGTGTNSTPKTMQVYDNRIVEADGSLTAVNTHKSAAVIDHPDGSITSAKIKDEAVTTEKIRDKAVTLDKLNPRTLFGLFGEVRVTYSSRIDEESPMIWQRLSNAEYTSPYFEKIFGKPYIDVQAQTDGAYVYNQEIWVDVDYSDDYGYEVVVGLCNEGEAEQEGKLFWTKPSNNNGDYVLGGVAAETKQISYDLATETLTFR